MGQFAEQLKEAEQESDSSGIATAALALSKPKQKKEVIEALDDAAQSGGTKSSIWIAPGWSNPIGDLSSGNPGVRANRSAGRRIAGGAWEVRTPDDIHNTKRRHFRAQYHCCATPVRGKS